MIGLMPDWMRKSAVAAPPGPPPMMITSRFFTKLPFGSRQVDRTFRISFCSPSQGSPPTPTSKRGRSRAVSFSRCPLKGRGRAIKCYLSLSEVVPPMSRIMPLSPPRLTARTKCNKTKGNRLAKPILSGSSSLAEPGCSTPFRLFFYLRQLATCILRS